MAKALGKNTKKATGKKVQSKKTTPAKAPIHIEYAEIFEGKRGFTVRAQISNSKNMIVNKYASKPGQVKEVWKGTEVGVGTGGLGSLEEAQSMATQMIGVCREEINKYFEGPPDDSDSE